jgi:endonuclease-3
LRDHEIRDAVKLLKEAYCKLKTPAVTEISDQFKDPFNVLISCILSLRTQDPVTAKASSRLFKIAASPEEMLKLSTDELEKIIYPVGFYKVKAKNIKDICTVLTKRLNSKVPDELDELLKLKGVGRKTANLVLTIGYGKDGICVDTHVHRICNRWGYIKTKTPFNTEMALRKKLPREYWQIINDLLVSYGQNICKPVSPYCSKCAIDKYCDRIGVKKSR